MSDVTENYNDSMSKYAENISKMTQSVQGIYTSEAYIRMLQIARRLSEGLQGIYFDPDCIKSIQYAQKIVVAFRLSVPKAYYNQKTLNRMENLAKSLPKSSFANIGNKELYEALQKNYAYQLKAFKQKDFRKLGEKIRHSMPDIDALSSNLQRAAKAVQTPEYKNSDEIDDEIYDEYSSDIEQILAGELTDEEIVERNEKSEGKFAKLIYWIITLFITTFITGYIEHLSEPVYEMIDKVVVKEDIDALGEEQVIFISKCVLSMSKYWNVDSDGAYKRLNEDFDIIKEYIIPEYDRLVELTDEELVLDIDAEYKKRQNTKIEDGFQKTSNYSDDELRFVVFCIESLAENMNVDPVIVHDALTKESDIVEQYIIPCYETLHTQGKEYIIENLKEVMAEREIAL